MTDTKKIVRCVIFGAIEKAAEPARGTTAFVGRDLICEVTDLMISSNHNG